MIKAAQWTSAIVGGMVFEALMSLYMPLPAEVAAAGLIIAIASVKIDEWRMA